MWIILTAAIPPILANLGMTGHIRSHPIKSNSPTYYLSLVKKSKTLVVSIQKYCWWQNPAMLLDESTFWSITWNYVNWIDILFYLDIDFSFRTTFSPTVHPRLPKGTLGKSKQVWARQDIPKVVVSDANFPEWISSW